MTQIKSNPLFKALDSCLTLILSPLYLFFRLFPRRAAPPVSPKRFLVVKLCCFGDTLLAFPALSALKAAFPGSRLTVLGSRRTAALFGRCPSVDEVRVLPISGLRGPGEFLKLPRVVREFLALRTADFDCLLDFDIYYRFTTLLGLVCGKAWSAGFETWKARARFYHHPAARPREEAEWRCFFNIMAPLNIPWSDPVLPVPIRLGTAEKENAAALLSKREAGEIRVGIVPGGSGNWPEKRWPLEHFAELMKMIRRAVKARFFLFGVKEELNLAGKLLKLYGGPDAETFAGRTPFGELAGLVREMDLFISNDTGPMHLAALSGVPTLGIFGPTSERKWSPPGRFRAVFLEEFPCRPCNYLSSMPECVKGFECLIGLSPARVFKAAGELMKWSVTLENSDHRV